MASNITVFAGTVGQSIWRSDDNGDTWDRSSVGALYMECDVRALAIHPSDPDIMFAGTDLGCYRSEDGGKTWTHLPSEMDATPIWALAIHPEHPDCMIAGVRPGALYRTENGGNTWHRLNTGIEPDCPPILHTRVTTILHDPGDPATVWAGVEIDGAYLSRDGGKSWTARSQGLNSMDVHSMAIFPGSPETIIAATNQGLCRSTDQGVSWQDLHVGDKFPWGYCRGIAPVADDSGRLLVGNGNGPPGDRGSIQWTDDLGETWHQAVLSEEPNSTIWHFATNPADPALIFAYSVSGQVFRSHDRGESWTGLRREFGEIRSMLWIKK